MRFKKLNRVVALTLASVMVLSSPVSVFADNTGVGGTPGSHSSSGKAPTQDMWGYRVTFGMISDVTTEMSELPLGSVTTDMLEDCRSKVTAGLEQKYVRPGEGAMLFLQKAGYNVVTTVSETGQQWAVDDVMLFGAGCKNQDEANELAWMIYDSPYDSTSRPFVDPTDQSKSTQARYSYDPELNELIVNAASSPDAETWLAAISAKMTAAGCRSPREMVQTAMCHPSGLHQSLSYFNWSAFSDANSGSADANYRVQWDQVGYVTAMIYFVLASTPGSTFRIDAAQKLYNWAASGYDPSQMPVLVVEMVSCNGLLGWGYQTLPAIITEYYPACSPSMLYAGWGDAGSTEAGIGSFLVGQERVGFSVGPIGQAVGGAWTNGIYVAGLGYKLGAAEPMVQRKHLRALSPTTNTNYFGYQIMWTYPVRFGPPQPGKAADGSFTWDLTPKGLIDKTPATEISESSTIYNLNVSQNGYNENNYTTKWEPLIRTDNKDCNRIKIDIYHISQKLPEGTEATVYTRDQVKAGGKPLNTAVDKVTVGDFTITNIPSLGSLKAGEMSRDLTDDEILNILKTGTGLTVTETVAGPLVVDDVPEGVRVTYAVYVTVYPGCTKTSVFSNNQQHYVEYRSEPGVYIYESDDPQGYAEIKCGYFDRDKGYAEPYEAMAGSPTTENLYFVSGGQEFVAQITYKYVKDKNTIRNFEQKYTTETCEAWYPKVTKTFNDTPADEVQAWLSANTTSGIPWNGSGGSNSVEPSDAAKQAWAAAQEAWKYAQEAWKDAQEAYNDVLRDPDADAGQREQARHILEDAEQVYQQAEFDYRKAEGDYAAAGVQGGSSGASSGWWTQSKACKQCGLVHDTTGKLVDANGVTSKAGNSVSISYGGGSGNLTHGDWYTEINLKAVRWDWDSCEETDDKGNVTHEHDEVSDSATSQGTHGSKTKVTRYSGTVTSYHKCFEENTACEKLTSSIKFQQQYENFNYAQAQKVHVWRLEKSRVEGIDQLTMDGNDVITAEIPEDELSQVIFNVAEKDTAIEGRMYYILHPNNADNFTFKETLKTRGCCHCYNHNAAEDLIKSAENPNKMYEAAWVISDYLVLQSSNSNHSLLYHEYSSLNSTSGTSGTWPICRIKISGTDQASRQDNGYTITTWSGGNQVVTGSDGSTDIETFYGWNKRGQAFKTDIISFNTSAAGGMANNLNGTEEKICQNSETFDGGPVSSSNKNSRGLAFGGYNGDYTGTSTDLAAGTDDLESVDKYAGRKGKNNWKGEKDKKIFKVGYQHNTQGELVPGLTESPQVMKTIPEPLMLVWNDIDVHDYDVHNGEKKFKNSSIFYRYIIGYKGGEIYDIDTNNDYKIAGFQKKTTYSDAANNINNIIIHNPVSAQYAKLIALPSELDQRTDRNPFIDKLNEDDGKCPGKAQSCKYAHINCQYNGDRFHTDDCYAKVRTGGLATTPVKGNITTEMKPVEIGDKVSGSQTFGVTGARQVFIAPATGTYKVDLYGGQGATSFAGGSGGRGGRVWGDVELQKGEHLYIWVGGQGSGQNGGVNGGGKGAGNSSGYGGGGGGYTRVDKESTLLAVAGGGGGSGSYNGNGGAGGWPAGSTGGDYYGTPGTGGSQSNGGAGGTNGGGSGSQWNGGSNNTHARSGGGGGGGGYFGGGAGGNDYPRFTDVDDSGGGGGSSYIGGLLKNTGYQNGVRVGNGAVTVSWSIDDKTIIYVPETTGTIQVGDGATPIGTMYKPQIYQAPVAGMYSVHLYGSRGGGATQGQPSAGGLGGHAAGQVYLTKGQKVLVTTGGIGGNGAVNSRVVEYEWRYPPQCGLAGRTFWGVDQSNAQCHKGSCIQTGNTRTIGGVASGGYNGGGHGGTGAGGGFGGGGATDVVLDYVNQTAVQMMTYTRGGTLSGGALSLPNTSTYYWGPRTDSEAGHIYRVDYWGENLDKATYDTFAYLPNGTAQQNNATKVHEFITSNYAQIFYRVNNPARAAGQEFRVFGGTGVVLREMWVVDMDDRILVAAGGGGADNAGGTYNGDDDGRGGAGGGNDGENGYRNGASYSGNGGAKATSGYLPGIGGDFRGGDAGGGGAGWYGGYGGAGGNDGGGGGSSNIRKVANGVTKSGQNSGSGYAIFIEPGKGDVPIAYQLSCSEPHHAPNLNYHRMISGWQHEGGYICDGERCALCTEGSMLYSPTGFAWNKTKFSQAFIVKHNGQYHLTYGNDTHCDQCDTDVTFDKYTLDDKNYRECVWRATSYNTAAFSTVGARSGKFHYAFGDDTCYDPCNDDEKHKVIKTDEYEEGGGREPAGQFVVLDYDFEAYFPNIGDFYGNGALGIPNTQYPEGHGYIDNMDTTIWLKEKYALFPFDVTYNGHTFLAGEKVMLGWYDEVNHVWHDDRPDDYRYTFHCLLNNWEAACVAIKFVAVAKNTPMSGTVTECKDEDHNYTRYGNNKRAYHDAVKKYVIDVLGRIGVLSIEDTGDFRFSNYYKQVLDGWRVNQVVHEVDLGKQNFVSVDQTTIFNDPVNDDTKGQNTWGLMDWMEPVDKLRSFPLTPGENNVKALKNQAHRIGYMDYMSLVTLGNYWGENVDDKDVHKLQIQPFYYYYNLETKEWVPVDVYVKTGNTYKIINKYGSTEAAAGPDGYNFYYDLNWEDEQVRRMYTAEERNATENVGNTYKNSKASETGVGDDAITSFNVRIPLGMRWLHGTANMLFLRDGNRTFIGSRYRYGVNTEQDGRISEVEFQRQGQRYNFTLGLPTQSAFVRKGEPCTPENIAKYDMDKGIIVVALDILAKGTVWTLEYDGTPVSEREFDLFNDGTQIVSWKNAGENGPEDKIVVVVYTDAKTSRNDLTTEGTH